MAAPIITRGVPAKRRARLENEKAIEKPTEKNENEYRLGAYGCTFILAPSMCLRLGAEDAALLAYYIRADGCSMILESEMQPRTARAEFAVDIAPHLSACATRVLTEENAGGSSSISESMSMELLHRAFGATLCKTELELAYFPRNGAITDFSVEIDGVELGVSVTRACAYGAFDAEALLRKKLTGVQRSTATCYNGAWSRQILHVWAEGKRVAAALRGALEHLEPALIGNTMVLVTTCDARDLPELFHESSAVAPKAARPLKGTKDAAHLRILAENERAMAS